MSVAPSGARAPAREGRSRAAADGLTRAFRAGEIDRATHALERAASVFDHGAVRRRFGSVERPDSHSATFLMRDLAASIDELSEAEQTKAQRILARPTDGAADPQDQGYASSAAIEDFCNSYQDEKTQKFSDICIHWATSTADAPDLTDSDHNTVPDYVDLVRGTLAQVWQREINELGYKPPLPDGQSGPTPGLDVYLADIGNDGIYGYCTNDKPKKDSRRQSAYCVLDNDYSAEDFAPGVHGVEALQVSAAHEFFHAVQFAYDWLERRFFMEGTAVWIEDEVFDEVNAHYEYLHDSALHQPEIPLDAGDTRPNENFEYGSWLFWQFMAERFSGPKTIKSVWNRASASNVYEALSGTLRQLNSNIANAYADFAEWNRVIDDNNFGLKLFSEGIAYMQAVNYRYPPTDGEFWLGAPRPSSGPRELRLDHLSMRYVLFQPGWITEEPTKLMLRVAAKDVPGARVRAVSIAANDVNGDFIFDETCQKTHSIALNQRGAGAKALPFSQATCGGESWEYSLIYLTLVNGGFKDSARFNYKATVIE